jgi:predicted PurR-regulated permease PerM
MNFIRQMIELVRKIRDRIVAHYRKEEVDHRKEDFYSEFAGGGRKLTLPSDGDPKGRRASRWASFFGLLAIVAVMGALFYRVMAAFFLPLFLALLLTVIFRPLYLWFVEKSGGLKRLSAGLTTAIVLFLALAPLAWAATLAVKEGNQLVAELKVADVQKRLEKVRKMAGLDMHYIQELNQVDKILTELLDAEADQTVEFQQSRLNDAREQLQAFRAELPERLQSRLEGRIVPLETLLQSSPDTMVPESDLEDALIYVEQIKQSMTGGPLNSWMTQQANPSEEQIRDWRRSSLEFATNNFFSATGATTGFVISFVVGLLIMVVSLYFFLVDGRVLLDLLMNFSPLEEVYERELLIEFDRVSRAVVVATLLSALVQALLAGFGFWVAGLEAVFLLIMLTFVLAMVPFVGAAAVWLPASLYLWFYEDRFGPAVFIFFYGLLVVSLSDNIIKPLVLHGQSKIHPLLALLSILGGVQALGPVGIFVGPMVVAFLQTLLKLLHREMVTLDANEARAERSSNRPAEDTSVPDAM